MIFFDFFLLLYELFQTHNALLSDPVLTTSHGWSPQAVSEPLSDGQ